MAAKQAAMKKAFDEGVTASRAGNHDAAIAGFQAATELNPNCFDCYYNIAFSETQKKDYDKAEAAYKKAIELKADYAEAYSGLANVYNAQRKFDLAATASAKAMELSGSAPGALGRRRQRRRDVQPGRHPLERGQDPRGEEAVRRRGRREPEPRRIALSARHGARERGEPRRRRHRVRDLSEARADRAERRDREGNPRLAEEVVIDAAALRARLADVRARIARAAGRAGRDPATIRLIAVSKTFPAEFVRAAADAGQIDFGENKVQDALVKMDQTADLALRWHLIGHLQSNKAKKAARFDVVHSIDAAALVQKLDEAADAAGRRLDLLVQVDIAGEATKHGVREDELSAIIQAARSARSCRCVGLMIIPPAVDDPEAARPYFRALREMRERLLARGVDASMLPGAVHGHEPRFRSGHRRGRHPRAGRDGDFRRPDLSVIRPCCQTV